MQRNYQAVVHKLCQILQVNNNIGECEPVYKSMSVSVLLKILDKKLTNIHYSNKQWRTTLRTTINYKYKAIVTEKFRFEFTTYSVF